MHRIISHSLVILALVAFAGCAASSGVGGNSDTETYNLEFDEVREAVVRALRTAGFRAVYEDLDEGQKYSVSAQHQQSRQTDATGGGNRTLRAGLQITVERLEDGAVSVRAVNQASQAHYGGSTDTNYHRDFFRRLNALLEQEQG